MLNHPPDHYKKWGRVQVRGRGWTTASSGCVYIEAILGHYQRCDGRCRESILHKPSPVTSSSQQIGLWTSEGCFRTGPSESAILSTHRAGTFLTITDAVMCLSRPSPDQRSRIYLSDDCDTSIITARIVKPRCRDIESARAWG